MFEAHLPPSAATAAGVYDPLDTDPHRLATLQTWLRVQKRWALAPQRAVSALRAGASPAALARDAGDVTDSLRALQRCGAQLVPWSSAAYPERLRQLVDAPPVLLVQGDVASFALRSVGIVGARAATVYGRSVAARFAEALSRAGVAVVSGLAAGIDGSAHEGALAGGAPTLAIQARGPDRVYPARHLELARRIARQGAVLTELPPGTPPRPAFFPLRNRLIAALSEIVLVVEARQRSGSLVTARHALDQGVDVMVVPGPIDAPTSAGPNALLRDGAAPALEPADLLSALGLDPAVASGPGPASGLAAGPALSAEGERVRRALAEGPVSRDELARSLGSSPEKLALALTELELGGWLVEDRDGRLRLCGGQHSGAG